jgi:hypothetical protein
VVSMSHPLPTNRRQKASTELSREQPIYGGSDVTVLGCTRAWKNGRSPADLPISSKCRGAGPASPGRSSGSGRRCFTDVGGRPAIAREAIRQKGYEPSILVVRGATGDHLVGQVGGADGVYQGLRIGFSWLSYERHLVRLGDTEV